LPPKELGRIDKPSAERFAGKRKLYLVPLIPPEGNAPEEYAKKAKLYWEQAAEQVRNLEASLGAAKRVYHESVSEAGEEGLKVLEKSNLTSYQMAREKCEGGAQLEALEDRSLLEELLDWERCLLLGFASEKVSGMVSRFYVEASNKRYEHISRRIDESLQADEAAVLFIGEGHRVQFPQDIEVFYVNPPALDELHRWLRERPERREPDRPTEERER